MWGTAQNHLRPTLKISSLTHVGFQINRVACDLHRLFIEDMVTRPLTCNANAGHFIFPRGELLSQRRCKVKY